MSAILHGCFQNSHFCVWHEGELHEPLLETLARIIKPPADELLGHATSLLLELPHCGDTPTPSRAFLIGESHARQPDVMRPIERSAVVLTPPSALVFLGLCLNGPHLLPDTLAGGDLLFWGDCLRYTGALVARGAYLPSIETIDDRGAYRAYWTPVFDINDRQRIKGLAQQMPPVARVLEPCCDPESLTQTALARLTDHIVRYTIASPLKRRLARAKSSISASDAFLDALRSTDAVIHWDDATDLQQLQQQISEWRAPIDHATQATSRYGFRLELPEEGDTAWRLHFFQIDSNGSERPYTDLAPHERRLALIALGHATRLFPAMASAKGLSPFRLPPSVAHKFIHGAAELLVAMGYQIYLPKELEHMGISLSLSAELLSDANVAFEGKARIDWQLQLGKTPVTPDELKALVKKGEPFAKLGEKWVEINPEQIATTLREFGRCYSESTSVSNVLRYAIGIKRGKGNLPITQVHTNGWLNEFIDRLRGGVTLTPAEAPNDFKGTLRPYQARGLSWLNFLNQWGFGGCLADDMGLGKTIQALALILKVRHEQREHKPILLVAPLSVLANWQREILRFTPTLSTAIHHGPERLLGSAFSEQAARVDLILTSYNLLRQDFTDTLRRVSWAGVILDEAQNIKNPRSGQSRAARALTAEFRVALTGTPIENGVTDLWSIMDFLNPGLLGTQEEFREAYARPIQQSAAHDDPLVKRLSQVTGPFLLRRLKSDKAIIDDLPPKIENKIYCILTPEQTELYRDVVKQFSEKLIGTDSKARRGHILAVLTQLKQICNHPSQFLGEQTPRLAGRSGKLMRLEEMLAETLAEGDGALIFTQYAQMGHLLQQRLSECFNDDIPFLHGGQSDKTRQELIDRYQRGVGSGLFILSLKAGGVGLNLTRANQVFHYDRWWNPAVENQATDRAYRIGQLKRVLVHAYICSGTLEDRIDELISSKQTLADQLIKSGESMLAQLSDEELRAVLTLAADAI